MRDAVPRPLANLCLDAICKEATASGWPQAQAWPEMLQEQMLFYLLRLEMYNEARQFVHQCSLSEIDLGAEAAVCVDDRWISAFRRNSGLSVLKLADCTEASAESVASLESLHQMEDLEMGCCQKLSSAALECIVKGMAELHSLRVHMSQAAQKIFLQPSCMQAMSKLKQLKTLRLNNMLGLGGTLGSSCLQLGGIAALSNLDVSDTDFDDVTIQSLPGLMNLTKLCVKGCTQITDDGCVALEQLPKLESLNLARTGVSDVTVARLEELCRLQDLNLSGTKVTNKCCDILNKMPSLTDVDLSCKKITSDGLRRLQSLSNLTSLNLAFSQVTDEGVQAVRQLPHLSCLSLRWTCITDTALAYLAGQPPGELDRSESESSSCSRRDGSGRRVSLSARPQNLPNSQPSIRRIRSDSTSTSSVHSLAHTHDGSSLAVSSAARPPPRNPPGQNPRAIQARATRNRQFSRSGDYTRELQRCRPTKSGLISLALVRTQAAQPNEEPVSSGPSNTASCESFTNITYGSSSDDDDTQSTSSQDSPEASPRESLSRADSGTTFSSQGSSSTQLSRSGDYARDLQLCRGPSSAARLSLVRCGHETSDRAPPGASAVVLDRKQQRRALGLPPTPPKSPPQTPELQLTPPRSPEQSMNMLGGQVADTPFLQIPSSRGCSLIKSCTADLLKGSAHADTDSQSLRPMSLFEQAKAACPHGPELPYAVDDDDSNDEAMADTMHLTDEPPTQMWWTSGLDDISGMMDSFPTSDYCDEPTFRGMNLDEVRDSASFSDEPILYRSVQDEAEFFTMQEPIYRSFELPTESPIEIHNSDGEGKAAAAAAAATSLLPAAVAAAGTPGTGSAATGCAIAAAVTAAAEAIPQEAHIYKEQQVEVEAKPSAWTAVESCDPGGPLQRIEVLDLSVTEVAGWGLHFLGQLPNLRSLNLFSTKVSDEGLQHIAGHRVLVDLNLCGTDITDIGVPHLLGIVSLVTLKVSGNKGITNVGAQKLLGLNALLHLETRSTSVTPDCSSDINKVLQNRALV